MNLFYVSSDHKMFNSMRALSAYIEKNNLPYKFTTILTENYFTATYNKDDFYSLVEYEHQLNEHPELLNTKHEIEIEK